MFKAIGAEELMKRGVTSLAQLRPVLGLNEHSGPFAGNATLRKDEWEQIDARVNDVLRERLTIADDIRGRGLVTPVSLGTILYVQERLDDMDDAEVSYDGDTAGQKDRPTFQREVVPVPVISKDFSFNWRQLDASRRRGETLDVTAAAIAARKVRDMVQAVITNGYTGGPGPGTTESAGGTSIPGLTTASNRIPVSLATNWDASGADIIGDVERMLDAAYTNLLMGPFFLYVPKNYWATLQKDYQLVGGVSTQTYMERIRGFVDIQNIRPLDALANDNVILLQMTEDVISLVEAQVVTTVQWEKNPFVQLFKVLEVGGPNIKSINKQSGGGAINGIVHLS
jgi:uncharacterized linocin/CFP29 family protein